MSNSFTHKKKTYVEDEELRELAEKVITDKNIDTGDARIKYMAVYPYVSPSAGARCRKSSPEMRFLGECEFIIQVSGEFWDKLDDARKEIIIWHELKHVGVKINDKNGSYEYFINDHDIKDFHAIIKEHGIEWYDQTKLLFSSVYDIEMPKLDKFHL